MAKRKKPLVAKDGNRELLLPPKPMRRGSLSQRYTKCGKRGCRCRTGGDARHGPYHSLTRSVGGTTRSRWLSDTQAELARHQLEEGDRFREDIETYWDACEELADAELELSDETSSREVEKGGSRRQSAPRSRRRSRSS